MERRDSNDEHLITEERKNSKHVTYSIKTLDPYGYFIHSSNNTKDQIIKTFLSF